MRCRRTKLRTVVLIVSDGLRWQEVFTGADARLMLTDKDPLSIGCPRRNYASVIGVRVPPKRGVKLLFPFLWGTVAKQGQIFGNPAEGQRWRTSANGKAFSYPGYNEMSTGFPNDAINSNEYGPNP